MNSPPLPLRPYLENIVELCQSLDRETLQQCILALAKQVQPAERQVFLQNLRAALPENNHREVAASTIEESLLLAEVDSIRREIEKRLQSIEDLSCRNDSDDDDLNRYSRNKKELLH